MGKGLGMKFEIMSVKMASTRLISEQKPFRCVNMKTRTSVLSVASIMVSVFFSVGLATIPSAFAVTPSGQVNYFNVSGGACTSTAWTGGTAIDGNVPGMFPNNIGGPPNTATVGTGSICIQVILSNATPNTTYTVTATQLNCTITIHTDGSGNGSGEAVCTSTFSGSCITNPLKMSPDTPYSLSGGTIAHVWVGTGTCGTTTTTTTTTTVTHGVPEFPAGMAILMLLAVPALLLLRKRASLLA